MIDFTDKELSTIDKALTGLPEGVVLLSNEINDDTVTIDVADSEDNTTASVTLSNEFVKEYKEEGIKAEVEEALHRERDND